MHIVFGVDDTYTMPCGVTIASILQTNPDTSIHFHIISQTLVEQNKRLLNDVIKGKKATLSFYNINDGNALEGLPICSQFPISVYYRLFIPLLLPTTISKALYIDSDMIVVDTLQPLWETDITHYPVAASIDRIHDDIRVYNRLGDHLTNGYYNSGMLLMNLDIWRKEGLTKKILEFVAANAENCLYPDQDGINCVLAGRIKKVPFKYNYISFQSLEDVYVRKELHEELFEAAKNPAIIHFIGLPKPWYQDSFHPLHNKWLEAKQHTPWKGQKLLSPHKGLNKYLAFRVWKKIMTKLKIA